ncbi:zf-HC2 domain-containing protein [Lacipirellula limnantheis]|uniref:Putative zinc-finger domain-containing protein n=1 Tax=Lacipirellula limnantheis TaxID=2528024 RepID=A0A517U677_9BACT|nr:zf-HC2 domain-containing protein [Lacipirellula limnantheis]QDT76103.1 hypothetical protein I41_53480 [Lacipirellula limnantheis]
MKERSKLSAWNLDCRAASELASESLDRPLGRGERLALRLHQLICPPCRHLIAQFHTVRRAVASLPTPWRRVWSEESIGLSAERRDAIKQLLQEASRSDEAD